MQRRLWLLLPAGFLFVTAVGIGLQPNPAGLGTHRALGLPQCLFLQWTGLPCPSCGLTTSFTHLLHGHLGAAFAAHPMGPLLFVAFAAGAVLSMAEFLNFRTPLSRFLRGQGVSWAYGALALFLATWIFRLLLIWRHAG